MKGQTNNEVRDDTTATSTGTCNQLPFTLPASFSYLPVMTKSESLTPKGSKTDDDSRLPVKEIGTFSKVIHSKSLMRREY
jgi:hypothetical protein